MVGRSNVGKSTLINAVLMRKGIARVSQTPGKTQAIQFYLINEKFYLVDLPGYGYAKVPKSIVSTWGELIRGYLENAADLKVIFLLLDIRRTPTNRTWRCTPGPVAGGRRRGSRAHEERQALEQPDRRPRTRHREGAPSRRRGPHHRVGRLQERHRRDPARDDRATLNEETMAPHETDNDTAVNEPKPPPPKIRPSRSARRARRRQAALAEEAETPRACRPPKKSPQPPPRGGSPEPVAAVPKRPKAERRAAETPENGNGAPQSRRRSPGRRAARHPHAQGDEASRSLQARQGARRRERLGHAQAGPDLRRSCRRRPRSRA